MLRVLSLLSISFLIGCGGGTGAVEENSLFGQLPTAGAGQTVDADMGAER